MFETTRTAEEVAYYNYTPNSNRFDLLDRLVCDQWDKKKLVDADDSDLSDD